MFLTGHENRGLHCSPVTHVCAGKGLERTGPIPLGSANVNSSLGTHFPLNNMQPYKNLFQQRHIANAHACVHA